MSGSEPPACPTSETPGVLAHQVFKETFPVLYDHTGLFDFSPPVGWYALLWRLSFLLAPLRVQVVQVKSKFGGLRVYLADHEGRPPSTERRNAYAVAHDLIASAEREAEGLCQRCGRAGKRREGSPFGPWCDEHTDGGKNWPA